MIFSKFSHLVCAFTFFTISSLAGATVVQMQTEYGDIEVNLFDETTPKTVANFLEYVNDGSYDNSLVHRSIENFITQGGGYYLNVNVDEDEKDIFTLSSVTRKPSVLNEPLYSNVRGTIAMAKLSSNPDSATSEWFINLADNSCNLDRQNSGFTVFGQLTENSLAFLDAIAALPTYNTSIINGVLTNTPLDNYTDPLTRENFVFINSMAVVDPNTNSAADLSLALNTLLAETDSSDCESNDGDSGGSFNASWLLLSVCLLMGRSRRKPYER
jgi:peptidyl-prolyl cis-trans isomerase A (cyclophilin A)